MADPRSSPCRSTDGCSTQGVHRALALTLFENRQLTLAQAAKVAELSLDGFLDLLGSLGLAAVDYPAEELADELAAAL
jgi:predicted HTH domain antitoxin